MSATFDEVINGQGRTVLDLGGNDGDAWRLDLVIEHDDRKPVTGEANQVALAEPGGGHWSAAGDIR